MFGRTQWPVVQLAERLVLVQEVAGSSPAGPANNKGQHGANNKKRLHLISGRSNLPLAKEIAEHLGVELAEPNLAEFANGEVHCRFSESVRGGDVFIIQSHSASEGMTINDSIMEQLIMVDAARRASAKRITVVCPFYGYARQDRKSEGREPITARLLATLFIAAGVNRMISVDLHSGQIQGFLKAC